MPSMIKLHNTLTKRLDELQPIAPSEVSMYTCGPTVYGRAHIGNLRTYIFEDILRRTLKISGYKVKHVMNITDVDDKTIARSRRDYPNDDPMAALRQLTSKYERAFLEDAQKVGIDLSASQIVKATDEIDEMKELIKKIPNKYIGDDGVYFDIEHYSDYGALVKLDRSHTHHRIANDEYDKEHVADFALWKTKKEGEPGWDFDVDGQAITGRPGWHIECSAIAAKYLGQPFDIHTGGVDLIFPHHENEIAQNRSASGKGLANIFVHSQHLLVDGKKMSKSLNNFYTLDDIEKKGYDPLAFRLLALQAHYRTQLNFTWQALAAAESFLNNLRAWADLKLQPQLGHKKQAADAYSQALDKIRSDLSGDLNTPQALSELSKLTALAEQQGVEPRKLQLFLEQIDQLLGLELANRQDVDEAVKDLIAQREQARAAQDWPKADQLREQLIHQGVEINDTPHGPIWSRV